MKMELIDESNLKENQDRMNTKARGRLVSIYNMLPDNDQNTVVICIEGEKEIVVIEDPEEFAKAFNDALDYCKAFKVANAAAA